MRTMLENRARVASRRSARIEKILVPFDFGEPAENALDFAQKLATSFGASVEVIYVVPYLPNAALPIPELGAIPMAAQTLEEVIADAEARLETVRAAGLPVKTTVSVGDPRAQRGALPRGVDGVGDDLHRQPGQRGDHLGPRRPDDHQHRRESRVERRLGGVAYQRLAAPLEQLLRAAHARGGAGGENDARHGC